MTARCSNTPEARTASNTHEGYHVNLVTAGGARKAGYASKETEDKRKRERKRERERERDRERDTERDREREREREREKRGRERERARRRLLLPVRLARRWRAEEGAAAPQGVGAQPSGGQLTTPPRRASRR